MRIEDLTKMELEIPVRLMVLMHYIFLIVELKVTLRIE